MLRKVKPASSLIAPAHLYTNLIFEGGSVKGIAYVGAIKKALQDNLIDLSKIERVGGTSAGAINALIIGLGFNVNELEHLTGLEVLASCDLPVLCFKDMLDGEGGELLFTLKNSDHKLEALLGKNCYQWLHQLTMIGNVNVIGQHSLPQTVLELSNLISKMTIVMNNVRNNYGLCSGELLKSIFHQLICRQVSKVTGRAADEPVTFQDLAKYPQFKKMYFVGVNARTFQHEIFSLETTPTMVVADAVRISMSIPGVFFPHRMHIKDEYGRSVPTGDFYIDGGVLKNYPLDIFDVAGEINKATLGFRLVPSPLKKLYERNADLTQIASVLFEGHAEAFRKAQSLGNKLTLSIQFIASCASLRDECQHALHGNFPRTIYIDIRDVGTLDFERVEDLKIKRAMIVEGQKGVVDFFQRRQRHLHLPNERIAQLKEERRQFDEEELKKNKVFDDQRDSFESLRKVHCAALEEKKLILEQLEQELQNDLPEVLSEEEDQGNDRLQEFSRVPQPTPIPVESLQRVFFQELRNDSSEVLSEEEDQSNDRSQEFSPVPVPTPVSTENHHAQVIYPVQQLQPSLYEYQQRPHFFRPPPLQPQVPQFSQSTSASPFYYGNQPMWPSPVPAHQPYYSTAQQSHQLPPPSLFFHPINHLQQPPVFMHVRPQYFYPVNHQVAQVSANDSSGLHGATSNSTEQLVGQNHNRFNPFNSSSGN